MHSCLFLPLLSGLVNYRFLTHSGRSSTKREAVPFYPQSSGHTTLPGGGSLSPLRQKRYRAQVCQIVRKYSTQRPKKLHSREKQNFLFSLYFGGVVKKIIKKECLSFYWLWLRWQFSELELWLRNGRRWIDYLKTVINTTPTHPPKKREKISVWEFEFNLLLFFFRVKNLRKNESLLRM